MRKSGVKYDISPVPPFAGGKPAKPFVAVQALYIAAKSKNKTLAQEFATNFFAQPDVAVALYQADPRPPALKAALARLETSDPLPRPDSSSRSSCSASSWRSACGRRCRCSMPATGWGWLWSSV